MFAQSRRIKFNFEKDKPPREFLLQPTATAAGAGEKKGGGSRLEVSQNLCGILRLPPWNFLLVLPP